MMAIVDNEASRDHHKDVVDCAPKSPWKIAVTPSQASVVSGDDGFSLTTDATDSDCWPALSDGQQTQHKSIKGVFDDSRSNKSQQKPIMLLDLGGARRNQSAPLRSVEPQKFNGHGNFRGLTKPSDPRPYKAGPRPYVNVGHYTLPGPYQQEARPLFQHAVLPMSYVPEPVYGDHPPFGPFPMPSYMPFHGSNQPPSADQVGLNFHSSKSRAEVQDQGFRPHWHGQQQAGSKDNVHFPNPTGPRPFMGPLFHPVPGFIGSTDFPGPSAAIYHVPYAPPASARLPYPPVFLQRSPGPAFVPSQIVELRSNIVKQIEYYFSDENLDKDHYLLSLMDEHGWVPISIIAGFKRVRRMTTDIPFILDALLSSNTIEVQNDKVRRRDKWSNWVGNKSHLQMSSSPNKYMESDSCLLNAGNELNDKERMEGTNTSPIMNDNISDQCIEDKDAEGGSGAIETKTDSQNSLADQENQECHTENDI